ncbi:hypothetical protein [Stutzerimonas balearica]|uniref:hypothetical protein n=1 Tax=Stutzerimonas balearica TaxID=74829 RepID=UPI0028A17673|nr:hypothetical protein [Stutzerimonas balearica]
MPTGYTAPIADGITFEQFVMGCARGFGALIMMRDEPANAPIPERFEPSDYHLCKLDEAHSRFDEISSLTPEACEHRAAQQYHDAETQRRIRIKEIGELRQKYDAMIQAVDEWAPPSAEHIHLKEFMRKQLTESIDFDCDASYYAIETPRLSGQVWLEQQLEKARRDIAYHEQQHKEEVERTNQRNEWLRLLRESLA